MRIRLGNLLQTLGLITAVITSTSAQGACGSGSPTITNLPTDGGAVFQVNGLNANGQLTGYFYTGSQSAHVFLYSAGSVTDLGTLGGSISEGFAINNQGRIAGDSSTAEGTFDALVSDATNIVDIGTLGGSFSSASVINNAGQVAGIASTDGDEVFDAFLYDGTTMHDLGNFGGGYSSAFGINSSGVVVGESALTNGDTHAFVYSGGVITDLGTLGDNYSSAFDINDAGVIVGESSTNGETHAFVYAGGTMIDLGTLGGTYSSATAVNGAGQVIGVATTAGDAQTHGLLYANGSLSDLGTFGGPNSFPRAINNPGQIVGSADNTNGESRAFLWQNGNLLDLNDLLPANSGWVLTSAQFINDAGRIVGTGTLNGVDQTFILDLSSANHAPVANAGADRTVECGTQVTLDAGQSSDPDGDALAFEWSSAGFTLGTNATLTGFFTLGTNVVTLKVTDACGEYSQAAVIVTVVDTTPPSIVGPGAVTVAAGTNCQAAVPGIVSQAVVSDGCTPSSSITVVQSPAAGTLVGLGQHVITLTAMDNSGNSSNAVVLLTVLDSTPPVILSAPVSSTVSVGANCQGAVPDVLSNLVASDNCTPANQLTLAQNPAAGSLVPKGQHTITVTVTDASGNSANTSVSLSVVDTTAPAILSVPGAQTVSVGANCQGAVPNVVSGVVASDNCTAPNQLTITQSPATGTLLAKGPYSITVTVTDASGNSTTGSVPLSVVDTTAPVILSVPGAQTVSVGANCQGAVPNVVSGVVASDNCTAANQLTITQSPAAGTLLAKGQYSITVTVTDASGNSTTGSVPLSVVDTSAPVILSVPGAQTVSVGASCQGAVPNVVSGVAASDNCTAANQLTITQSPAAGTLLAKGQYSITVTVTDASGNSTTGSVPLSVVDTSAPVILSVPGAQTVSVGASCQGAVPNVVSGVVASDNCTAANQLTITQSPAAGTLLAKGQYSITVTVTDASGNSTTGSVPLSVIDTTAPVIQSLSASPNVLSPPNHQMVPITVSASATDNCDSAPVSRIISITANEALSAGDVQITGNLTALLAATRNGANGGRVYTITVQCTDADGNSSTGVVTVTVPQGNGKK